MNARTFLNKYKDANFRHSERLIAGLVSGQCDLLSVQTTDNQLLTPCSHYLFIHRWRIQMYERHTASTYNRSLVADWTALCEELEKTPDEGARLWHFSLPPRFTLGIFEGASSERILGCVLLVNHDSRKEPV